MKTQSEIPADGVTRVTYRAHTWKAGDCATHRILGNCIVLRVFPKSGACWLEVWGGPCGDKKIRFRGQRLSDLSPRPALRRA